jgi:hypothetical protein
MSAERNAQRRRARVCRHVDVGYAMTRMAFEGDEGLASALDVADRKLNDERGIRCARRQGCDKDGGDDDSLRAYDESPRVTLLPETTPAHSESPEVEHAPYVHALRGTAK